VEQAAGRPVNDVMREQLSSRIGLRAAEWRPVVEADGTPGFRLWMSARDMARFGLLVAAHGQWAGEPVLRDTAFLAAMLSPQAADNPAYGYLWWLNGQSAYRLPGPMTLPTFDGPLLPDAPPDLVSALGRGDKKIYVSRALDVVVVRHGADASDDVLPLGPSSFDAELWRRLRPAMRY
jgi:CubicO group peptidase (beta-lactamase class C family)